MAIPPGTIQALRRSPASIVTVVVGTAGLTSLLAGQPWASIAIVLISFIFYDIRRSGEEASERRLAELRVEEAVAKADAVRARHLDLLTQVQATLPLAGDLGVSPRLGKGK
jgi:small-conductance mechanosensitive channel